MSTAVQSVSGAMAMATTKPRRLSPRVGEVAVLTLWGVFVGLTVMDLLTTLYGLSHHAVEVNPLTGSIINAYGVPGLWGYKAVVLAGVLWAVRPFSMRIRIGAFIMIDVVMTLVVISNLNVLGQLGALR